MGLLGKSKKTSINNTKQTARPKKTGISGGRCEDCGGFVELKTAITGLSRHDNKLYFQCNQCGIVYKM